MAKGLNKSWSRRASAVRSVSKCLSPSSRQAKRDKDILIDRDTISFKYDTGLGKKRKVTMSKAAIVKVANEALSNIPIADYGGL